MEKEFTQASVNDAGRSAGIKTMAAFTAANLKDAEAIKETYIGILAKGQHGNLQPPLVVFNMSLDAAKLSASIHGLTSLVHSWIRYDGTFHNEYWELEDPEAPYHKRTNNFVMKEKNNELEYESDGDDLLTIAGRRFHYSLPLSQFQSIGNAIYSRAAQLADAENARLTVTRHTPDDVIDFAINRVGFAAYYHRRVLYSKLKPK